MTCEIIATGSRGNAVLLDGAYLIDCGIPAKQLKPYYKKLRLVFLTHIHGDHFSPTTLRSIHKHRPSLRFVCPPDLLVPLCTAAQIHPDNITVLEPGQEAIFPHEPGGDLTVSPFSLLHNVPNVGWLFQNDHGTALYATDTLRIPIDAPELDLYLIEANYKGDDLQRRKEKKLAQGGYIYEDNVAVSHQSFETAMEWLSRNASPDSKIVFLHQHVEAEKEE
jgi:ribonuclease BN (tRNA processing enzyme)